MVHLSLSPPSLPAADHPACDTALSPATATWKSSSLEPLIPKASPGGRPRKTDMRAAMNAILYLLRTGCPWRYLPRDGFPPRSTVYNIFRKFQREGIWEAIWAELHMALRERMGREASPSAAVLDSQSVF
jgi:putative transposase